MKARASETEMFGTRCIAALSRPVSPSSVDNWTSGLSEPANSSVPISKDADCPACFVCSSFTVNSTPFNETRPENDVDAGPVPFETRASSVTTRGGIPSATARSPEHVIVYSRVPAAASRLWKAEKEWIRKSSASDSGKLDGFASPEQPGRESTALTQQMYRG